MNHTFDPTWESIYSQGSHLNRYPFDAVVSFVFSYRPQNQPIEQTHILEVGCGAGNNLWFAAREGFKVAGIDGSKTAISYAKQRFKNENLESDLQTADFTHLPFNNEKFHLIIDRCAITHSDNQGMKKAISEVHRVLKNNGHFLFSTFADTHTSASMGTYNYDTQTVTNIMGGSLVNVGQVSFLSLNEIKRLLPEKTWELISAQRVETTDFAHAPHQIQAEWRVIAKKISN
jgi:2-polyprenyl-3-methyl-5-hydroxy-6-metoxy-1,4-benzoquinol methylase